MMNFAGITHVIENPKEHAPGYVYSLVGSVPVCMMDECKATVSDIMGGRSTKSGTAFNGRKWETVAAIVAEAAKHADVKLCDSPACACRRLF